MENKKAKIDEGVTFLIIKPDGKILMQLRDDGNGQTIPYPNMWSIPGGGVEAGEDYVETVIREVKEEYCLDIDEDQIKWVMKYQHDNDTLIDQVFVCKVPQDVKPVLCEGADMQWMSMDEIKELKLAWELNTILPQLEKKLI